MNQIEEFKKLASEYEVKFTPMFQDEAIRDMGYQDPSIDGLIKGVCAGVAITSIKAKLKEPQSINLWEKYRDTVKAAEYRELSEALPGEDINETSRYGELSLFLPHQSDAIVLLTDYSSQRQDLTEKYRKKEEEIEKRSMNKGFAGSLFGVSKDKENEFNEKKKKELSELEKEKKEKDSSLRKKMFHLMIPTTTEESIDFISKNVCDPGNHYMIRGAMIRSVINEHVKFDMPCFVVMHFENGTHGVAVYKNSDKDGVSFFVDANSGEWVGRWSRVLDVMGYMAIKQYEGTLIGKWEFVHYKVG
ncbi:Uncharacterized protein MCB1EB_1883 [Mycoavidus cysteinexigens]|uniref:Uncharacterized protein n=1 Tax=Mycoavidus cysteinexigens TaxID=1553431 RepID=A0A2Z6EX41_9BURK|nr:hypothetical protein [Mycoavidus cysteinexigens]BBE10044.1 Uncharacterized protein MCB1EB_1883 [Mycoavidus cysteinexigens]GAM53614.1 hypothetical protein EBME_2077 [bacterium endosymbiont of Mortierella elongata FMR23-6]GLR00460.1 hypothetical protein GCM10007934_02710 [Mycoavidus cysteinexigens]